MEFLLLVPKHQNQYDRGTAFVASKMHNEYYNIHYEPPSDAVNITTFEHRIRHAAGRLKESYPTSKMMGGSFEDWIEVGTVSYKENLGWIIDELKKPDILSEWDSDMHYEGGSPQMHEEAMIKKVNEDIRAGRISVI